MREAEQTARAWAERFASASMGGRGEATYAAAAEGAAIVPVLIEILTTGRTEWGHPYSYASRCGAVISLRIMGEKALEARDVLVSLVRAGEGVLAREAVGALGRLGQAAAPITIPVLISALQGAADGSAEISFEAASALAKLGGASAIDALIRALTDAPLSSRAAAIHALTALGAEARAAVPVLERMLGDPDPYARARARAALLAIDPTR